MNINKVLNEKNLENTLQSSNYQLNNEDEEKKENQNTENDFDYLYNENEPDKTPSPQKPERLLRYLLIISCEVLLSLIASILVLLLSSSDSMYVNVDTRGNAISNVKRDSLGITMLTPEEFSEYFQVEYSEYLNPENDFGVTVFNVSLVFNRIIIGNKTIDINEIPDPDEFLNDFFFSNNPYPKFHFYLSLDMVPLSVKNTYSEEMLITLLSDYIIPRRMMKAIVNSLINFTAYAVIFVLVLLIGKVDIKEDFNEINTIRKKENITSKIVLGILTLYLVSFVLNIFVLSLTESLNIEINNSVNQEAIDSLLSSFWPAFFMILSATLIGPFVEEMVFRKAIFGIFKNPIVSIIVSSLLFGLIHVTSEPTVLLMFIQGISYVGLGAALGYLYQKHKYNIFYVYLIHAGYNLVSFLLTFLLQG
jgi:membrane protease YdiL (CAAX protease family)